jgi:hypothetical protein
MTQTDLEAALGPADRTFRRHAEHVLRYRALGLDVGFASAPALFGGERVVSIRAVLPSARTATGIGPGVARTRLRGGLGRHHLDCFTKARVSTLARATVCFTGAEGFGTAGTSFTLRSSRIQRVDVYRVLSAE